MRGRADGRNAPRRDVAEELSSEQMTLVNGGISRALHNSNERAKHNLHRLNEQSKHNLQKIGKFIGKEVVNVAKHTPIGMAVTGAVAIKNHKFKEFAKDTATHMADNVTHGFASKVINPLRSGARGKNALAQIGIGVAGHALDQAASATKVGKVLSPAIKVGVGVAARAGVSAATRAGTRAATAAATRSATRAAGTAATRTLTRLAPQAAPKIVRGLQQAQKIGRTAYKIADKADRAHQTINDVRNALGQQGQGGQTGGQPSGAKGNRSGKNNQ